MKLLNAVNAFHLFNTPNEFDVLHKFIQAFGVVHIKGDTGGEIISWHFDEANRIILFHIEQINFTEIKIDL